MTAKRLAITISRVIPNEIPTMMKQKEKVVVRYLPESPTSARFPGEKNHTILPVGFAVVFAAWGYVSKMREKAKFPFDSPLALGAGILS